MFFLCVAVRFISIGLFNMQGECPFNCVPSVYKGVAMGVRSLCHLSETPCFPAGRMNVCTVRAAGSD